MGMPYVRIGQKVVGQEQETDNWQQYFVGLKLQAIFIFSL